MKLAILDLYDGTPNLGMDCIRAIVEEFIDAITSYKVFDVRMDGEVPDLSFDIYISSGGPGSPLVGDGIWDKKYFEWLDAVWAWNNQANDPHDKKHVLFICHSYQMMVNHFQLALVSKRHKKSFGTFPVHKWEAGSEEPLFEPLPNPFHVADFRDFQVTESNRTKMQEMGAKIIALETEYPNSDYERAIMGIRLSDEMIGVQFHPEADQPGMLSHFREAERKDYVVENFGAEKYEEMINDLEDDRKIKLTHKTIIPTFLRMATR